MLFFQKIRRTFLKIMPLILIGVILFGSYLYEAGFFEQDRPLVAALLTFLLAFAPGVIENIQGLFGNANRNPYVKQILNRCSRFINKYFLINQPVKIELDESIPIANHVENYISGLKFKNLGTVPQTNRRKKIISMVFLIREADSGEKGQQEYENLISYIRERFKSFDQNYQNDFWRIYSRVVIDKKIHVHELTYFGKISSNRVEEARKHFYNLYLPNDLVNEITEQLKFEKGKAKAFKNAIASIASSGRLSLGFLDKFVHSKKKYKKLYILASKSGLSQEVQLFIKQGAYFILNYTSIANLPAVGLSKRMDIFFFAPNRYFRNAEDLFRFLAKIDPRVLSHPLKVYEIDPLSGLNNAFGNDVQFSQAVHYFEDSEFDPSDLTELSPAQKINALMEKGVSLKEILQGLSPAEYSIAIIDLEKEPFTKIVRPFIRDSHGQDIFQLPVVKVKVQREIEKMAVSDFGINYSNAIVRELFAGKVTVKKLRKRFIGLLNEVAENLNVVEDFLA